MRTIKTATNLRWNEAKTAVVCDVVWEDNGVLLFGGEAMPCAVSDEYKDEYKRLTAGEFGPIGEPRAEVVQVTEETLDSRMDAIARDWGFRSFVEATTYILSSLDLPQKRKAFALIEFRDKILAGEATIEDTPKEIQ